MRNNEYHEIVSTVISNHIDYPGKGPTTYWVVHSRVLAKSFGVKSVVCHRVVFGLLCAESWYAVGCVQSAWVQSVGVK